MALPPPGSGHYEQIHTVEDIGHLLKQVRKAQGVSQRELADLADKGPGFVLEVENGKPTVQMQKVLELLQAAGLDVFIRVRG